MTRLTENDEGKRVVNTDGDTVGMITGFRGGRAYVDPEPGIGSQIKSRLGWDDVDQGDYALENNEVERVTDEEVHLR